MENTEKDKLTVIVTRVAIRPENRKEFFQTITPLINLIRNEKGCLTYRLYEEAGDENSLILIGEWQTSANWEHHRKGNNFAVLLGSITVLSIQTKTDFELFNSKQTNSLTADNRVSLADGYKYKITKLLEKSV